MTELDQVEALLAKPSYRPFPLPAAALAEQFDCTPQAIVNLGRRPHTGVKRYTSGYDFWQVKRWMLKRDEKQATRRQRTVLTKV